MALARWEPFRDLETVRERMERVLEEPFFRRRWERVGPIPLDMYEMDNELVVTAALPGFRPEDIHVNVTDSILSIRADRKEEREVARESYYHKELRVGHFARQVTLPFPVETDQVQANYENGMLILHLPKAAKVRGKQIKVGVGQA